MIWVIGALLPGVAMTLWTFGAGYLGNLAWATGCALAAEAACLAWRAKPLQQLTDGSALVTAILLALALPPALHPGVIGVAVICAIGLGKHLFGGLGHNVFNPAIVGYAVVLVSFPAALAGWPELAQSVGGVPSLDGVPSIDGVPTVDGVPSVDGVTAATALDAMRYRDGLTVAEVWRAPTFGTVGGAHWEWINVAFLVGGLVLCIRGVAAWRVPAGLLATMGMLALLTYAAGGSTSTGGVLFHWFSGATMLGAFFFATDPVTHPASTRGQWLFGATIGAMAFAVRAYGNYPDGIAFGILLANALTPLLDRREVAHA